mmetsp:Transcript_15335/g.25921  ORF Transcript_15335/g.25921 Transcript_15335/m.25921 type:complete len:113 (+) Transcript_15335:142-480(+)
MFDINSATLSGAVDIIVVEQPDGTLKSSPFHVRFGKLTLFKATGKTVEVHVNGQMTAIRMKLGKEGQASFIKQQDSLSSSVICKSKEEEYRAEGFTEGLKENEPISVPPKQP